MVRRLEAGQPVRALAEAIDLSTTTVRRQIRRRRHWGWSSLRIARDLQPPLPTVVQA